MNKMRKRGRPPYDDVLTRTEWAIVHAVQHGMTTREIAERRGVSFDAVKFHIDNAMEKLGVTNRQALRHWFQTPKDSALNKQSASIPRAIKVGQISRSVHNIQQSEVWYRDILQLPHLFTVGEFAFFDCDGTRLYLSQTKSEPATESIIYFEVADIQSAYKTMLGRGIVFINSPHMIHRHADGTEEWMAFFKDLEDRPLAIMSKVKAIL